MKSIVARLRKIALHYGIKKVSQVVEGDEHISANGVEAYVNCAQISGREIVLGIFDTATGSASSQPPSSM